MSKSTYNTAINANGGYCPCQVKSAATKCHCADFRNKKVIKDIICDALASAQPQVPEEFAKATLKSIARRLSAIVKPVWDCRKRKDAL